ncbi:hypothetical protein STEG23_038250, partial [Scotinomys teguina]
MCNCLLSPHGDTTREDANGLCTMFTKTQHSELVHIMTLFALDLEYSLPDMHEALALFRALHILNLATPPFTNEKKQLDRWSSTSLGEAPVMSLTAIDSGDSVSLTDVLSGLTSCRERANANE